MKGLLAGACLLGVALSAFGETDATVAAARAAVRDFHLTIPAPVDWNFVSAQEVPYHVPGRFLVGWSRQTDSGPAVIYVVAQRLSRNVDARDVGRASAANLTECGLQPRVTYGPGPFGKDSARVSARGQGTGATLAKLVPNYGGDTPTVWVDSIAFNDWSARHGGDLIQIVMTCPAAAGAELVPLFDALLERSQTTTDRYLPDDADSASTTLALAGRDSVSPPKPTAPPAKVPAATPHPGEATAASRPPAPPAAPAPAVTAPAPTADGTPAAAPAGPPASDAGPSPPVAPTPQGEVKVGGLTIPFVVEGVEAGPGPGGAPPVVEAGATAGPGLDHTLIGAVHGVNPAGVRTVNIRFLLADATQGGDQWVAPPERDVPVYFCITADRKTCYVLPATALDALAEPRPTGGRLLRRTAGLEPYKDRWDLLWP